MKNLRSRMIRNQGFTLIELLVVIATLGINTMLSHAQDATIQVYADHTIKQISPYLTGACIEDVNHEIYGGIYSQMIFGESFEEGPLKIDPRHPDFLGLSGTVSCIAKRRYLSKNSEIRSWQPFQKKDAQAQFTCFSENTYNGEQSQTITLLSGEGEIGIENQGLNRWGIIDFVDLCEAAGFECIPALNTNESVQDIVDFVEYMNGPVTSEWGKIRSENGHQEPYYLKYIQIGNEQMLNSFYTQLETLSDAIWNKDNTIQIIIGMSWKLKEDIDANGQYFKMQKHRQRFGCNCQKKRRRQTAEYAGIKYRSRAY